MSAAVTYITIVSRPYEIALVQALAAKLGDKLLVGSHLAFDPGYGATLWPVELMGMGDAKWSARILAKFLETGGSRGVKIDPDTVITGSGPSMEWGGASVCGDFRRSDLSPLIWMGGYQGFTRSAAEKLLTHLKGPTTYQDFAMAGALVRSELVAFNHPEINAWAHPSDPVTAAYHRGRPLWLARHGLGLHQHGKS